MHPTPGLPQEKTRTWVLGGRVFPRWPPPQRGADKTGEAEFSSHPSSAPKLSVAPYCPPNEPNSFWPFRPLRAEPQLPPVFPPHPLSLPSPLARPASPASWEHCQSYHPRAVPSLEGRPIPLCGPACVCEGSLRDKKVRVPPSAGPARSREHAVDCGCLSSAPLPPDPTAAPGFFPLRSSGNPLEFLQGPRSLWASLLIFHK